MIGRDVVRYLKLIERGYDLMATGGVLGFLGGDLFYGVAMRLFKRAGQLHPPLLDEMVDNLLGADW